jgi:CDP-2,3-bis-(O-geranylgeranyl)-sn-glycerol synthase
MLLPSLLEVVWFILPAWVANSVAIDVSGVPFLKRYSTPVDFGGSWKGKRILGDGKTWRGLIAGTLAGIACGAFQGGLEPAGLYRMTPLLGFLLGFGALFGDMAESFVKRRIGMDRGHPWFLMDQLDYIFGAYAFAWAVVPVDLGYLVLTCLITVPVHFVSSIIAWKLSLKKNPW